MRTEPLKIIAGTPDRPLVISGSEIPCYVLEDETRVLSQGGFLRAIGRTGGSSVGREAPFKLPVFLRAKNLSRYISSDLEATSNPIEFQDVGGMFVAAGYRAVLLPGVCTVYLDARRAGVLYKSQEHIAQRAEILLSGLATVGIIALVDEATGYQNVRVDRALATILEKYIAREIQPWVKTFPDEFYMEMFRLNRWSKPDGAKRPSVIGRFTNDIVYDRLAPGVLEELRQINPTLTTGGRQHRHHQWFTPEFGHPKLNQHLTVVIALMQAAPNWPFFQRSLQRVFPKLNAKIPFASEE